jgi:hypothetical protein
VVCAGGEEGSWNGIIEATSRKTQHHWAIPVIPPWKVLNPVRRIRDPGPGDEPLTGTDFGLCSGKWDFWDEAGRNRLPVALSKNPVATTVLKRPIVKVRDSFQTTHLPVLNDRENDFEAGCPVCGPLQPDDEVVSIDIAIHISIQGILVDGEQNVPKNRWHYASL